MNISQVYKYALGIFPKLTLSKTEDGRGIDLKNGNSLISTFRGTPQYIEDQLKLFLLGMIEGNRLS